MAHQESTGRPACDRCKGQKLRCIWEPGSTVCHRCTRAQAVCQLPQPRPVGRPRRNPITTTAGSAPSRTSTADAFTRQQDADLSCVYMGGAAKDPLASVLPNGAQFDMGWNMGIQPPATDAGLPMGIVSPTQAAQFNVCNWDLATAGTYGSPPFRGGGSVSHSAGINTTMSGAIVGNTYAYSTSSSVPGLQLDFGMTFDNDGISDASDQHHVDWLKQLCDLNVALYQHPLYVKPNAGSMDGSVASTPSDSSSHSSSRGTLSGLQIGRVLSMTYQLRTIAKQHASAYFSHYPSDTISSIDPEGLAKQSQDRSTIVMILSCYMRLESIYTQALEALADIKRRGPPPDESYQLMPELSVDGYSLGYSQNLQLNFVIQLCEQTLSSIKESVKAIRAGM